MLKPPRDNSRIDTAIIENDSSAPTIQRTTRTSLDGFTGLIAIRCRGWAFRAFV